MPQRFSLSAEVILSYCFQLVKNFFKKFFQDFKKFAKRGNVVDMAVGVIIGSAFTAIVNSLVKDILMPLIVWLFPVQDLSNLCIVLRPESVEGAGDALTWNYGNFIMAVINFLIVAFVLFIVLRSIMNARGFVADKYPFIDKKEEKQLRKEGKTKEEMKAINDERKAAKEKEEALKKAQEEAESEKGLLKRAVELLEQIEKK